MRHIDDRPLVIGIDELDRCRPSYAIEMLELAKHLFAVDHVVFALAVNRSELAHSVKVLYGQDFDAARYLRRFFDLDFRLPQPDRTAFIKQLMEATELNDHLERQDRRPTRSNSSDHCLTGSCKHSSRKTRSRCATSHRRSTT